ncbi:MAG: proline--tRNA ligase [Nanoarchaeota archaeon]|nr:proline--tRNA ligase [Nanoarchaeota archaeon]
MSEKTLGITAKKSEDFSEWYTQIVQKAELADIRFGIQGFIVHRPWAFKISRKIYEYFEKEVEKDNHEPFLFPIAIKEKNLKKEAEHAGFTPEVFWVNEAGSEKLEERFALRPTGEAQIYPMYSLWIRGNKDLPLKGYQSRITVFRNEKTTRPFLRGREFMFFETHDVFATHKEAIAQVKKDLNICKKIMTQKLKIPFLFFKRPEWDKFMGADETFTPDTLMPDGKRNQLASTHDLGTNFAKAFNIKFLDKDEKTKYPYQTCFGPGIWRQMAALIAIHGDDQGLILPFEIAPIQIIIIPIFSKSNKKDSERILKKCEEIKKELSNYEVKIDNSDNTPGFKYNQWELKGVPLRIEIGPKEVKEKKVTIKRRTDRKQINTTLKSLKKEIQKQALELDKQIKENAEKYFKDKIKDASSLEKVKKIIRKYRGFIRVPFCSTGKEGKKCADILKEKTEGGVVCGNLYPKPEIPKKDDKCIICDKKAKQIVYVAKSY